MISTPDRGRRHRSAFAAAFLSFLFPGLGQAYAGRPARALVFAAPPLLALALLAGLLVNRTTREGLAFSLASPTVLLIVLGLNIALLVYRGAAVVDAYRIASRERTVPAVVRPTPSGLSTARLLSVAGLVAVLLVLSAGHVAAARFNLLAYDAVTGISGGDNDPIPSGDPGTVGEDIPTLPPLPTDAGATTGAPGVATGAPSAAPAATDAPPPTWDGKERLNILLIGADRREGGATYLTDTLIVASIDPVSRQVAMFSLPRDTQGVPLPREWAASARFGGVFPSKINTLYTTARRLPNLFPGTDAQRGYNAVKGALGALYGLDIKYYVALDFAGFLNVVNTLGGAVIDVQVPVTDDHYPTDDGRGALNLYIPPGVQVMDGKTALAYARARHATSDFDRAQRQQRVITSLRHQTDLSSLLVPGRLESLVRAFKETVRTDIPPELFPQLIGLAQSVDLDNLRSVVFTPPRFQTECLSCYSLTPKIDAIRQAVQEAFTLDPAAEARQEKLAAEKANVRVLNGSGKTAQADEVAAYLSNLGMLARNGGGADRTSYSDTVITVYNGREDAVPETVKVLEETFGVSALHVDDPTTTDDIVVITGANTRLPSSAR